MKKIIIVIAAVALVAAACNKTEIKTAASQLDVKAYLVDKYNPGTSFGIPGFANDKQIKQEIEEDPEILDYITAKYKVKNQEELYLKVRQFHQVTLERAAGGYDFVLQDGKSCTVITLRGAVAVSVDKMEVVNVQTTTENVPC